MFGIFSFAFNQIHLFLAATPEPCTLDSHKFFGLIPPWWEFLSGSLDPLGQCAPVFHFPADILAVGLAVLDMLIRLAGFAAVVSIIIAGAAYIFAIGDPQKITNSRKRIQNALIGLAIAFVAASVVGFLGGYLK